MDCHRRDRVAEGPGGTADQVTGIGGHHLQQGFEMVPFALQFGVAGQGQAPAGEDADRLAALARRHIWKAFHRQATTDLFVAVAELDHDGQLAEGSGRIGAWGSGGSTADPGGQGSGSRRLAFSLSTPPLPAQRARLRIS